MLKKQLNPLTTSASQHIEKNQLISLISIQYISKYLLMISMQQKEDKTKIFVIYWSMLISDFQ